MEGGFVIVMMGIYNSMGSAIGTIIGFMGKVNLSNKGHSREYYMFIENNGCPPPSYYGYKIDGAAHTHHFKSWD